MLRSYIEVDESTHAALNPQITDNSRSENRIKRLSKFAGFMFALSVATAAFGQTGLNRVGPVANGPGGNGYPAWYQDKIGLTLDFCSPTTDAVLAGGWCVLLTGDLPSVPEVFPTNFFDEHFYFLANATGTTLNGGKAKLVLALEGAFGGGVPLAGDQIVFARVRFVVDNLPQNGTYTIYHPYGTDVFPNQVQGDRLFFTEDIGIGCPSGFECANTGRIGPYLLPADTPGGPELAATRGPDGRLYLTDPNRLGPITKSPVGQNYFRVVAPDGTDILNVPVDASGQRKITDFTLNGRVVEGSLPGRVNVDRATFSSDNGRVDVFASIFPTLQARVPGAAVPGAPTPLLQYYSGACTASPTGVLSAPTGQSAAGMRALGNSAWGQSTGATQGNPSQVCLEDRTSSAFFQGNVTDLIRVTQAEYDPANGSLTVTATSSDTAAVLTLGEFNAPLNMNSGTGSVTVTAGAAPPQIIHVSSKIGGTG